MDRLRLPTVSTVMTTLKRSTRDFARYIFRIFLKIVFTNNPGKIGQLYYKGRCQLVWLNEHVGRKILLRMYEWKESRFFEKTIKPGDVCFDVGANVGYYTNLFASKVGRQGRVVAIEPILRNALLIQLASVVNKTDTVVNVICAVALDRDGQVALANQHDSCYSYVDVNASAEDKMLVAGKTLDSLVDELKISKVDVVKMDIEGAEYMALMGMKKILSNDLLKPRLMMIELVSEHLKRFGVTIDGICSLLKAFGYRPHILNKKGNLITYGPKHYDHVSNVFFVRTTQYEVSK